MNRPWSNPSKKPSSSSSRNSTPSPSPRHSTLVLLFATGGGAGYAPWAPGTAGSLLAIPLSLALNRMAAFSLPLSLLTLGAFIAVSYWFCNEAEAILQEKDSPKIVMDEMAGFLVASYLAPGGWTALLVAFLAFRFFDIVKVYPANRAQALRGGLGIMIDDLIAGSYTLILLRVLYGWTYLK